MKAGMENGEVAEGCHIPENVEVVRGDWLTMRRAGLGGSDMATLMGANQYERAGAVAVWEKKTGRTPDRSAGWRAKMGLAIEPDLIRALEAEIEQEVFHFGDQSFRLKERPWEMVSPDGLGARGFGVECKLTSSKYKSQWGDAPFGDVRPDAYIQSQWAMNVLGRSTWYVCVLFDDIGAFQYYVVERDQKVIDDLVYVAKDFWKLVLSDEPPMEPGQYHNARYYPRSNGRGRVSYKAAFEDLVARQREQAQHMVKQAMEGVRVARGQDTEAWARAFLGAARRMEEDYETAVEQIIQRHGGKK